MEVADWIAAEVTAHQHRCPSPLWSQAGWAPWDALTGWSILERVTREEWIAASIAVQRLNPHPSLHPREIQSAIEAARRARASEQRAEAASDPDCPACGGTGRGTVWLTDHARFRPGSRDQRLPRAGERIVIWCPLQCRLSEWMRSQATGEYAAKMRSYTDFPMGSIRFSRPPQPGEADFPEPEWVSDLPSRHFGAF